MSASTGTLGKLEFPVWSSLQFPGLPMALGRVQAPGGWSTSLLPSEGPWVPFIPQELGKNESPCRAWLWNLELSARFEMRLASHSPGDSKQRNLERSLCVCVRALALVRVCVYVCACGCANVCAGGEGGWQKIALLGGGSLRRVLIASQPPRKALLLLPTPPLKLEKRQS